MLNKQSKYLHHGVVDLLYATGSPRKYLIAFKPNTKEVYVAFRGTENLKSLLPSMKVFGMPNHFQGRFHGGFKDQADEISLEPFYYFLDKYPDIKLIFTGHSLGGAIAAVVTSNMLVDGQTDDRRRRISCVAFGAPVLCDKECSIYLNERYKNQFHFYINQSDVVPYIFCLLHNFATNLLEQNADVVDNVQKCENWIENLLKLESLHTLDEKYEWFTFLNRFTSSTIFSSVLSSLKIDTFLLSKCLVILKKIVPMYCPFGQCFRTRSCTFGNGNPDQPTEFYVERMIIDDLMHQWISLDVDLLVNSFVVNIQDHFILSYIREIHENVIVKQKLVESPPVSQVKLTCEGDISPLTVFLLPFIDEWSWDASSKLNQPTRIEDDSDTNYTWSAISCEYEDDFIEISLRLRGSTVSLISELRYGPHENYGPPVNYEMQLEKAKLQDINDEYVRLFILQTHKNQLPWLRYVIVGHFGDVDLTTVFDRNQFVSMAGLTGRKHQIAELSLLDLYNHALSYCLFTSRLPYEKQNLSTSKTAEDDKRRDAVRKNILLCEKLQENTIKLIEKTWYKSNPEMIRQVEKLILDGKTKMDRFDKSPANPDVQTIRQLPLSPVKQEPDISPIKTTPLSDIMSIWEATHIESTDIISQAVPTLYGMYLSMTATFQMEAMNALRSKDWTKSQAVVAVGASAVVAFTGVGIMYPIWVACIAALAVGAGMSRAFYRYFSVMKREYLEMLLLVAQSIGLSTNRLLIHPFILEKEISDIYRKRIHQYPNDDYIIANWSKLFDVRNLIDSPKNSVIPYWLNLLKCVDAHHQLRNLLSQDFAVGVVGGGKTGKSQLIARLFGFPTQPDLNVRTMKMTSYRVSDHFRVIDFPHMNSSIDALKRCFTCHHTLVNAIIVILNGEQRGDDAQTEGYVVEIVKNLAAESDGVKVLFCFNRCDRLALCQPRPKSSGIKKREQTSGKPTTSSDSQWSVYWTKEDVEKNKIEFATRAYGLKPENCMMTFFALDHDDDPNWWQIHDSLKAIGLSTYDDIKSKWLREILEKNGLEPAAIEQILNFEYEE